MSTVIKTRSVKIKLRQVEVKKVSLKPATKSCDTINSPQWLGERIPEQWTGNAECSLPQFRTCPWYQVVIRASRTQSSTSWSATDWRQGVTDVRRHPWICSLLSVVLFCIQHLCCVFAVVVHVPISRPETWRARRQRRLIANGRLVTAVMPKVGRAPTSALYPTISSCLLATFRTTSTMRSLLSSSPVSWLIDGLPCSSI